MKVAIRPGTEKEGLIMKSEIHTVQVTVQMTEEEKAAAKAAGILKEPLFFVPWDAKRGTGTEYTISDIVNGFDQTGKFPDFLAASQFAADVKEMLVKLKTALEAKMNEGDEEFEL